MSSPPRPRTPSPPLRAGSCSVLSLSQQPDDSFVGGQSTGRSNTAAHLDALRPNPNVAPIALGSRHFLGKGSGEIARFLQDIREVQKVQEESAVSSRNEVAREIATIVPMLATPAASAKNTPMNSARPLSTRRSKPALSHRGSEADPLSARRAPHYTPMARVQTELARLPSPRARLSSTASAAYFETFIGHDAGHAGRDSSPNRLVASTSPQQPMMESNLPGWLAAYADDETFDPDEGVIVIGGECHYYRMLRVVSCGCCSIASSRTEWQYDLLKGRNTNHGNVFIVLIVNLPKE